MEHVYVITDFGAVGDGVTDSTQAIQAAIDKAASHGYAKVVVPPGVYSVGRIHLHGQYIALEGCSAWSFRNDGASVFTLNTADHIRCIRSSSGLTQNSKLKISPYEKIYIGIFCNDADSFAGSTEQDNRQGYRL